MVHFVACNGCMRKFEDHEPKPKHCGKCKSVWYCNRACQKKHWKQQHRGDCPDMVGNPARIRCMICTVGIFDSTPNVSAANSINQLNLMAGDVKFLVKPVRGRQQLFMEFEDELAARTWCNRANTEIFPNQCCGIAFYREGKDAMDLEGKLRLPEVFEHLLNYIFEGDIFFENGTWHGRHPIKTIGHYEIGYGLEDFENGWMKRQFERLRASFTNPAAAA